MMHVWQGLTGREKILMGVAGVLAVLVLVYILVLRPLATYRTAAARDYDRAVALYENVATLARQMALVSADAAPQQAGAAQSVRVLVSLAARDAGVTVSRIQPAADGTLTFWVDESPAPAAYAWLVLLQEKHAISPVKVSLAKTGAGGLVRAQVVFVGAE